MNSLGALGITLRFQPQYNLHTHKIVATEALTTGVGDPEEYFRRAEADGTIHEIGFSVIRQAAVQIEKWQDQGFDITKTFVNVSHHQIRKGFCSEVIEILSEYRIENYMLGMEFTEYIDFGRLSNDQESEIMLLKATGFELAMDDFGMGNTSLYNLELGVFDKLKIDKKFMAALHEHGPSYKIVNMLSKLANDLNIEIVAEGIELEDQISALMEAGVYIGQGNLLCSAIAPENIPSKMVSEYIHKAKVFAG